MNQIKKIILGLVFGIAISGVSQNVEAKETTDLEVVTVPMEMIADGAVYESVGGCEMLAALYQVDENGNEVILDADVDINVHENNGKTQVPVQATGVDKVSSDRTAKNGVLLGGEIGWTDVPGTNNVLRYVSGYCSNNCEYNAYSYGTGPYFLSQTWHSQSNFGEFFYDSSKAGKTANSFVLEIKARPVGGSDIILRIYTKLSD